jgi:hypothetical protein
MITDAVALSAIWGAIIASWTACVALVWIADFFTDIAGDK